MIDAVICRFGECDLRSVDCRSEPFKSNSNICISGFFHNFTAAASACRQQFGQNYSLVSPGDAATNIEVNNVLKVTCVKQLMFVVRLSCLQHATISGQCSASSGATVARSGLTNLRNNPFFFSTGILLSNQTTIYSSVHLFRKVNMFRWLSVN